MTHPFSLDATERDLANPVRQTVQRDTAVLGAEPSSVGRDIQGVGDGPSERRRRSRRRRQLTGW